MRVPTISAAVARPAWPTGSSLSRYLRPSASTTWNPSAAPRSLPLTIRSGSRGAIPDGPAAIASGVSGWQMVARAEPGRARHVVGRVHVARRARPLQRQRAIDLAGQRVAHEQRRVELAEPGGPRRRGHVRGVVLVPGHRPIGEAAQRRVGGAAGARDPQRRSQAQRQRGGGDGADGGAAGHAHVRARWATFTGGGPIGAGCGARPRRLHQQAPVPARDGERDRQPDPDQNDVADREAPPRQREDVQADQHQTARRHVAQPHAHRVERRLPLVFALPIRGQEQRLPDRRLHRVVDAVLGGLGHRDHRQRRQHRDRAVAAHRHRRQQEQRQAGAARLEDARHQQRLHDQRRRVHQAVEAPRRTAR